jgi:hypothetical protein
VLQFANPQFTKPPFRPTPYPAHSTPYPTHSTPYPAHSTPYPAHSTPYPAYFTPYPAHSIPYPAYSIPYPAHSTPYPAHSTPYPAYSIPYLAHIDLNKFAIIYSDCDSNRKMPTIASTTATTATTTTTSVILTTGSFVSLMSVQPSGGVPFTSINRQTLFCSPPVSLPESLLRIHRSTNYNFGSASLISRPKFLLRIMSFYLSIERQRGI